jgi:hypothetical protein
MIVAAIRSILTGTPAVLSDVSTRVYPLVVPEGTSLPALVMQEINHRQEFSLDHISRVQITTLAQSTGSEYGYDIAHRIRDSVRASLVGYSGMYGAVGIDDIRHIGDVEMMDTEIDRFLIHSDYYVYWS